MTDHYYNVDIKWDKERNGIMCSPELAGSSNNCSCIEVATPPQFAKGVPGIWLPDIYLR